MARNKLELEIQKYLGLPYFKNAGKYKNNGPNALVGKGSAKEIALETINLANQENINLLNFSPQEIYNFQKKHHLGIDCSGLTCHLLNFYFDLNLNPRRTSSNMLTSSPLSTKVNQPKTGDLIRQKDGSHVLFIVKKSGQILTYVDSSRQGRGVRYGNIPISPQLALYRLVDQLK